MQPTQPPAIIEQASQHSPPPMVALAFNSTFRSLDTNGVPFEIEAAAVLERARAEIRKARVAAACFSGITEGWTAFKLEFRKDPAKIRDERAKIIFLTHASDALKELAVSMQAAESSLTNLAARNISPGASNEVRETVSSAKRILDLLDRPGRLRTMLLGTNDSDLKPYILAADRFAPKATAAILSDLIRLGDESREPGAPAREAERITQISVWSSDLGDRVRKILQKQQARR